MTENRRIRSRKVAKNPPKQQTNKKRKKRGGQCREAQNISQRKIKIKMIPPEPANKTIPTNVKMWSSLSNTSSCTLQVVLIL